jgi:kumamolisin
MSSSSPKRISLPHSERTAPADATLVGRAGPEQIISVSLIVKRRNPLDLAVMGGRTVTREVFEAQYGADPANFEALRNFAHEHGLTVDEAASSLARRTLVLRGPAGAMEQAFGVELSVYQQTLPSHRRGRRVRRRFHAFAGRISLPESHVGLVEAVLGLDARPVAKPHCRFLKDLKRKKGAANSQPTPFDPPQVAALYDFPSGLNGSGQTIGIVELGGGYRTSDLNTYFEGLALKPPTVVAVSVDGGTNAPGDPHGADGEVALDLEVAGAIAPGAKLAVYFAPNSDQGFIDAISTAVHDTANRPSVLSISWGGPESSWPRSSMTALDSACQDAVALGVTITVASGDSGSTDGVPDGKSHVDFPASSPHVLACGGTELIGNGSAIVSEVVWNDGSSGGATGGGYSASFPLPSWQGTAGVSGSGRGVPDVAGDAAPETGYNILVDGQQEVVGGTSAVAPLWAALIVLINQRRGNPAGFINPMLYQLRADFRDITKGNNGAYRASAGWDACTGLGSPDGRQIATGLAA